MTKKQASYERVYKRLMLRSSFQSLFWSIIIDRKKKKNLKMKDLSYELGVDKSYISRSFSTPPNWQIDKISDFADALGVEIDLVARDLRSGEIFTPTGKLKFSETKTEFSDGKISDAKFSVTTIQRPELEFVA